MASTIKVGDVEMNNTLRNRSEDSTILNYCNLNQLFSMSSWAKFSFILFTFPSTTPKVHYY